MGSRPCAVAIGNLLSMCEDLGPILLPEVVYHTVQLRGRVQLGENISNVKEKKKKKKKLENTADELTSLGWMTVWVISALVSKLVAISPIVA